MFKKPFVSGFISFKRDEPKRQSGLPVGKDLVDGKFKVKNDMTKKLGDHAVKPTATTGFISFATPYGSKAEWESVGKTQNDRVKKAQFEEYSKLSMDIPKALDQEQVDFKNNKDMQSQLFLIEKNQKRFERISKISQASKLGARGLGDIDTTIDTAAQVSQMVDGAPINETILNPVMTGDNIEKLMAKFKRQILQPYISEDILMDFNTNIEDKGPGTNSNDPMPKTDQAATMNTIDNSYQQTAIQQIKQQLSFTYRQNPKNLTIAFKNPQIANDFSDPKK